MLAPWLPRCLLHLLTHLAHRGDPRRIDGFVVQPSGLRNRLAVLALQRRDLGTGQDVVAAHDALAVGVRSWVLVLTFGTPVSLLAAASNEWLVPCSRSKLPANRPSDAELLTVAAQGIDARPVDAMVCAHRTTVRQFVRDVGLDRRFQRLDLGSGNGVVPATYGSSVHAEDGSSGGLHRHIRDLLRNGRPKWM